MTEAQLFLFITFCGVLGLLLKRNLMNSLLALLQTLIGIHGIFFIMISNDGFDELGIMLIAFAILNFALFLVVLSVQMIKYRSTLNVDEITQMRG